MRPYVGGNPGQIQDPNIRESIMALHNYALQLNQFVGRAATYNSSNTAPGVSTGGGVTSHHALTNLTTFDDHTQYLYLAGRSPSQTLTCASASSIGLIIKAAPSQSADLLRLTDSTPTVTYLKVASDGQTTLASSTTAGVLNLPGNSGGTQLRIGTSGSVMEFSAGASTHTITQTGDVLWQSKGIRINCTDTTKKALTVTYQSVPTVNIVEFTGSSGTLSFLTKDGYWNARQLQLNGTTSGTLSLIPAATTTSYSLTWPSAQGGASTFLQNNGSGTLSWAAAGTGDALLAGTGQVWTQENEWSLALIIAGQTWNPATPTPATPASGKAKLFSDSTFPRTLPMWADPTNMTKMLQPSFGWTGCGWWVPNTSTTITVMNSALGTSVGTIATQAPGTSGGLGGYRANTVTSAAGANSVATVFENQQHLWLGNSAGRGGFYCVFRGGFNKDTTTFYGFVGLAAQTTSIGTTTASSLKSCLGFGFEAGDTNFSFFNASSTTGTKTDTGIAIHANPYQWEIYAAPNTTTVYWRMTQLDTAISPVTGSVSTNIPASTAMLAMHWHMNIGASPTVPAKITMIRTYFECDV